MTAAIFFMWAIAPQRIDVTGTAMPVRIRSAKKKGKPYEGSCRSRSPRLQLSISPTPRPAHSGPVCLRPLTPMCFVLIGVNP